MSEKIFYLYEDDKPEGQHNLVMLFTTYKARADKKAEIDSSLKLQELVKERINELLEKSTVECQKVVKMDRKYYCECECCLDFEMLQSLVEESEKKT